MSNEEARPRRRERRQRIRLHDFTSDEQHVLNLTKYSVQVKIVTEDLFPEPLTAQRWIFAAYKSAIRKLHPDFRTRKCCALLISQSVVTQLLSGTFSPNDGKKEFRMCTLFCHSQFDFDMFTLVTWRGYFLPRSSCSNGPDRNLSAVWAYWRETGDSRSNQASYC